MNVDALRDQLADYNRKLDRSLHLNARILQETRLRRTSASLRWLSRSLWVELLFNAAGVVLLGNFIADHWAEPRFVAAAIVLDLCAILLVVAGAHQLAALSAVDYGAPILAIQKRLARLKTLRIRVTQWVLILSPLLWTPLCIVCLRGFLGVDAYASGPAWLLANLLFGVLFLVVMVWASRRYGDRMQKSPAIQRLMNTIAGRELTAALAFLESLSRLETEDALG